MEYKRDLLLRDLRESVVEVHFTKVNGENRVMKCTLKRSMLPEDYAKEEVKEETFHESNPDVLAVWDINSRGWRSFRIDSVYYAQIIDTY